MSDYAESIEHVTEEVKDQLRALLRDAADGVSRAGKEVSVTRTVEFSSSTERPSYLATVLNDVAENI